ncbi:RNA ligase family protein [Halomicrococcus gelatinilyticus]|uniref:RNA ligase family protein n=1 Tax=Halomicrococcus gelatinilyticus TaxID=1702103 RepID=UPI002E0F3809
MKQFPAVPDVEEAPDSLLAGGHLWLQESVDGALLRFQLRDSGMLRFGDRDRTFDAGEIPPPYRHAVRHVRENVDRSALRDAVDDVASVVCFGVATHQHAVDYDWDRTPSFLGHDVWFADDERFLPPDAVEKLYSGIGLRPVNAFRKEVRAVDFDPDAYGIPASEWYDGPAAGVVVRNKRGVRAAISNPEVRTPDEPDALDASAVDLARAYATDRRFERVADGLAASGRPVTADALFERVFETVVREEHRRLFVEGRDLDVSAFRSELASLTQRFVADRD